MFKDYVGFGALGEALLALEHEKYTRVFVVASENGWKRFNQNGIQSFFPDRECFFFSDFSNNPDFSEIQRGTALYHDFKPDLIVAIGGGSPIDVAKVIKILAHTREEYDPQQPATLKPSGDGPPLVAIATTAGSGSETTRYAVFYRGENKQSIAHAAIRPQIAIVDPELTYAMPPRLTAETGFDALSHAVEAYWNSFTTPEAQEHATSAIRLILPNLYNAVHEPTPNNRYHMAIAAYQAGKAIQITRTTIPHALGYHLTKRYGLAHGHAVAVTLPLMLLINCDPAVEIITPAGPEAHRAAMQDLIHLLGQETPEDAAAFWCNLMKACGLESTLAEVGVKTKEQVKALLESLNNTNLGTHPVAVDMDLLMRYFWK